MAPIREPRLGYVPHFDVSAVDGRRLHYDEVWHRRNLVLVVFRANEREAAAQYASRLQARAEEFWLEESTVVVTVDVVPSLSAPIVVVADRWGEILFLDSPADPTWRAPDVDELLSWVHFAQIQCPECPP
jgi:hypothetical protein